MFVFFILPIMRGLGNNKFEPKGMRFQYDAVFLDVFQMQSTQILEIKISLFKLIFVFLATS